MPNIYNFSVSQFTFTEAVSDAVYAANMVSGGTMTITPYAGYTVSASDFAANNPLPGQFSSVTFADSGTAATLDNTVIVTFVFSTLFEMSADLENINLPISGHARLFEDENRILKYLVSINDDTVANINGSTKVFVNDVEQSKTTSGGVETVVLSGEAIINTNTLIGNLKTEADAGFIFNNSPIISLQNMPEGSVFLQLESVEQRDGEEDVYIFNHKIGLIGSDDINIDGDGKVFVEYKGIASKSTDKEITQIIYGNPEININGEKRIIEVIGNAGAEFDLSVTKASDNSSIIDTNLSNASVLHEPAGLIKGINKTLAAETTNRDLAKFTFEQDFPKQSSATTYHINVTPKSPTILNSNLTQSMPQVILTQNINPTLTFSATTGTGGTKISTNTPSDITYIGRPNKKPFEIKNNKKVVSYFNISYSLTHTSGAGNAVTLDATPKWSSTDASNSDWSNSVVATNGGTHVEIVDMVATAGDPTATFTATVLIKKFGTSNVDMELDLSNIFNT